MPHLSVCVLIWFMHVLISFPPPSPLPVFSSLDMSRSVSVTAAGQCRLAPLIQVILDSSHLYDYTVKLLFKLHSCESHTPLLFIPHNYTLTRSGTQCFGGMHHRYLPCCLLLI